MTEVHMSSAEFATGQLRSFFEGFAAASTSAALDAPARFDAPTILIAGPAGARAVNTADMIRAIPERRAMLQSLGCRRTTLAALDETPLDGRYTLARAEWRWDFER